MREIKNRFVPQTKAELFRFLPTLVIFAAFTAYAFIQREALQSAVGAFMDIRKGMFLLSLLWVMIIFLLVFWPRLPEKADRVFSICYAIASVPWFFLLGEMITAEATRGSWFLRVFGTAVTNTKTLPYNLLLIGLFVLFFTLVTNSLLAGPSIAGGLLVLFAAANVYVTGFRGNAITAADFAVVGTALNVAGEYKFTLELRLMVAIMLGLLFRAAGIKLRRTKLFPSWQAHMIFAACGLLIFTLGLRFFVFSSYLKDHGVTISYFNTMRSYRANGLPVTLARSVQDSFPTEPEGYSPQEAARIAAAFSSDEAAAAGSVPSEKAPNVIVILDESFADLQLVGPFEMTEDPMPFLNSLKKDCVKGVTYASVRGGQTANTEFEFLTGHTMGLLPPGTVPFQIYIKSTHPSMASQMAALAYGGIDAFHPWDDENYRRDVVYPYLGFDTFYYRDTCPLPLRNYRRYTSDESDFENLIALYEQYRSGSEAPWFFYNMTVQSHSPFDKEYDNFTTTIMPKGLSRKYKDVGQYLSLVKASDEAFEKVVEYFSKVKEPTVIFFAGDHQPKLSNGFYNELAGSTGPSRGVEGNMILYQVPFWIWANFDIPEEDKILTSYNFLAPRILSLYGSPLTGYQKFLMELSEDIPVINAFGYFTKEGTFYETFDKSSPYYERIRDYAILQYNCLFDAKKRVPDFFELK